MADQSLPRTPERAAEAAARQAAAKERNANRPARTPETFRSSALGGDVQMPKSLPATAAPRAAEATGRPLAAPERPVAPIQEARAAQPVAPAPKSLAPKAPVQVPRDVPRVNSVPPMGVQGAPPAMTTAVPSVDKMFQPNAIQKLPDIAKSASPDGNKFLANSQYNNIKRG